MVVARVGVGGGGAQLGVMGSQSHVGNSSDDSSDLIAERARENRSVASESADKDPNLVPVRNHHAREPTVVSPCTVRLATLEVP